MTQTFCDLVSPSVLQEGLGLLGHLTNKKSGIEWTLGYGKGSSKPGSSITHFETQFLQLVKAAIIHSVGHLQESALTLGQL